MEMKSQTRRESNIREILASLKKIYSSFSFVSIVRPTLIQKPINSFTSFILDHIMKHEEVCVVGKGKIGGLEISTDKNGILWDFYDFSEILIGYHKKAEKNPRNCKYLIPCGCTHSERTHKEIEYCIPYSTQDFTIHTTYDPCSMDSSGRGCREYENKFGNLKSLKKILKDFED